MPLSFGFFSDPALTTPVSARLQFVQDVAAPAAADKCIYFGSPLPGRVCKAASAPGVDPVTVSVSDASPGAGSPAGDVKLALSSGGLAAATGGAALSLPATVASGVAAAIAIHIRVLDSTGSSGVHVDLGVTTNALKEYTA